MSKFATIAVGDEVLVSVFRRPITQDKFETVTKVTKTTFSTKSGIFSKMTGRLHGCPDWRPVTAHLATEEVRKFVAQEKEKQALALRVRCAKDALAALDVTEDNVEVVEAFLCGLIWGK